MSLVPLPGALASWINASSWLVFFRNPLFVAEEAPIERMEEPSALAAVFLPGDLRPVLPSPQTRKSREALPDVRSVATAAAEAARSFDWSLLQGASLLEGASCPTNSEEVEIAGVGLCVSAREPCALLSRHALPPHLPTFVSAQSACLYTPKTGDVVVGLITSKGREFYDVRERTGQQESCRFALWLARVCLSGCL